MLKRANRDVPGANVGNMRTSGKETTKHFADAGKSLLNTMSRCHAREETTFRL